MSQEVYVDVRHLNFWWGYYGLTSPTSWEDLIFYEKQGEDFVKIGATCVCGQGFFEHGLENLEDDPTQKEYVEEIKRFLQGNEIIYDYSYDDPEDEDFHEVAYDAPPNEQGVRPRYMDMWYPSGEVDMQAVDVCTRAFCAKFLHKQVDTVRLKEIPSFKEAFDTYKESLAEMGEGPIKVDFSDELVEGLEKE